MEQEKVTISLEEKVEKVKDLRPIDDVFFEVLADDIPFVRKCCVFFLRTKIWLSKM